MQRMALFVTFSDTSDRSQKQYNTRNVNNFTWQFNFYVTTRYLVVVRLKHTTLKNPQKTTAARSP